MNFFFDRDIRISTNITVQMAAAAEIFCKNFNQAEVMNSVAAAALEENRSDAANGCLQNRGTIKQISMEQCLVRVMRLGLVSWFSMGQVVAAMAEKILKPHSVDSLEMVAARCAVIFASALGLQQCQFEGDSETVIKALQGCDLLDSSIGHFRSSSFTHIVR